MTCSRITHPVPIIVGLLTSLLWPTFAFSIDAQALSASYAARGFSVPYDAAHEITVTGNVQEILTKHVVGSPIGVHLLVAGPQGIVDAHLGPYLSKDTQEALHLGTPVQIVGAMESLHGKHILLARQLILGGRILTIRNLHGFLVQAHAARGASSDNERKAGTESNGGSR